jgi:Porin PorA
MATAITSRPTSDSPTNLRRTTRRRRPRWPLVAVAAGVLLTIAAALWRSLAVPALERFPTDVDQHPRYEGTFTLFIDPATASPLSNPSSAVLSIDRSVQGVPGDSTYERVLIRETIAYAVEGRGPVEQVHQYVMDRRTAANVDDPSAWAFESANRLDRSGAYWVAMPRSSDGDSPVTMFKDEIGTTFVARPTGSTEEVNGLRLVEFDGSGTAQPLTDAYLTDLASGMPVPRSLSFEELKPLLVSAGVQVDAALEALVRVASPADLTALAAMTGQPIALEYVDTFTGRTLVEPDTGAIVDVSSVVEQVGARPAPDALPPLLVILDRYRSEPAVGAVVEALERLGGRSIPVFEYRYAQTRASVAEIASWVGEQHDRLVLAERTIPLTAAMVGAALVMLGVGASSWRAWRSRR